MNVSLAGKSVIILVANGVDEPQMTEVQRALAKAGAMIRTVAPEQGLVNSWHGDAWGHYHPVDGVIGEALGSDYDVLVIPGGERGTAKLRENLHTRRIVNHFLDANKPVSAIGEAVELLTLGARIAGRTVACKPVAMAALKAAGLECEPDSVVIDANLLTATGPEPEVWVEETLQMIADSELVREAA